MSSDEQKPVVAAKAPTMADVANRAGVSRALVSTVFRGVAGASPETRDRIMRSAAELGYRLDKRARMLRRNRTRLLGVMFRVGDAFHSDLVTAMYLLSLIHIYGRGHDHSQWVALLKFLMKRWRVRGASNT